MPPEIELALKLPDDFEGKHEFLEELRRRIGDVEKACALERERTGRRVVGRRSILRRSWQDSPTSHEPRRNLKPRVAARNKWLRIARILGDKDWQVEYREARRRWKAGEPYAFPYGTYWLQRFANVIVKAPEPAASI